MKRILLGGFVRIKSIEMKDRRGGKRERERDEKEQRQCDGL